MEKTFAVGSNSDWNYISEHASLNSMQTKTIDTNFINQFKTISEELTKKRPTKP